MGVTTFFGKKQLYIRSYERARLDYRLVTQAIGLLSVGLWSKWLKTSGNAYLATILRP